MEDQVMSDNQFPTAVDKLLSGLSSVLTTKTVVGDPIYVKDTIILPLMDVSFGIGAGSSVKDKKNGSTGGVGGKMTPSAVLIIKDGYTKLVNVKKTDSMSKILDMVPDIVDRFAKPKDGVDVSDTEAVDMAFPDEGDE